jgi:hypothetical protein
MKAEIVTFAKDFRDGMLRDKSSAWMCRAVCMPLSTLLVMQGFDVDLTEGTVICDEYEIEHTWLTLKDGTILDPTADQFNEHISYWDMPPVYLGEKPQCYLRMDE